MGRAVQRPPRARARAHVRRRLHEATLTALAIGVGVGALILVPSLTWLYRLVLQGRLDQEFEPLDQRFRPLSASDSERPSR